MAFDSRAFRDALGDFPTGVVVVTATPPAADAALGKLAADATLGKLTADAALGKLAADATLGKSESHVGITVNSFASVSLDPPLVLWCMDKRSQRHDVFVAAPHFTISILGAAHREVSSRLARPGEHSLEGVALTPTGLGPPGLADSLAVFECSRESTLEGGDHTILVGRVLRFSRRGEGTPLLFFRGNYSGLAPSR